ncbi:MAG: TetR/AcrR family transcriptional regulator [Clostridia bacterium]|nr:TetR/AcrR family transcriptional regulator [Clostridia bacterium]
MTTVSTTPRKTDRRTLYTRRVIKDALLELLGQEPYNKLNVTMICKGAEITRATFYLHYSGLDEVLDEVIGEALELAEEAGDPSDYEARVQRLMRVLSGGPQALRGNEQLLPPCQRIADPAKYRALFMDDSLSYYVIRRIYLAERDSAVPWIARQSGVREEDADRLFMLMIYGLYYVNRSMKWEKNEDWYRMQYLVHHMFWAGLQGIAVLPETGRDPKT